VVSINTHIHPHADPLQEQDSPLFFDDQDAPQQSDLGSGVIMSAEGYVLTNNHVVEGADAIEVTLPDTRHAAARLIGADPESDLAVLKIALDKLPVMPLGDSDQLQVGDQVLAIGNPFGVGQTVTSGIVSALGRDQLGINTFENFIQTDAAINPGNSGGALIDVSGHLLGINTAIFSRSGGSMGIGFAIPVSTAKLVLQDIVKTGHVVRGWIGVESSELTPELAQTFGLDADDQGVIVTGVLNNGPAARAGIRPGDAITQVAGRPVHSALELLTRIAALPPGHAATFALRRGSQQMQAEVTPAQRPRPRRNAAGGR
jgi:Do/DeqQ family serine protease